MEDRKKGRNFTPFEKNYLIDLIHNKKNIIENKKSDSSSLEMKSRAWDHITVCYNTSQQSGERTTKQLKEVYQVLKRTARKNLAADRAEHYKTGGGLFVGKSTDLDKKIVAATTEQFLPDENPYDSSADFLQDADISKVLMPRRNVCSQQVQKAKENITREHSYTEKDKENMSPTIAVPDTDIYSEIPNQPLLIQVSPTVCAPQQSAGNTPSTSCDHHTTVESHRKIPPTSRKKKHPVDNLTAIIQDRKKFKNKLDELEIVNKKALQEVVLQERRELHQLNVQYRQKILEEQELKLEGVRLDNEIKKIELQIRRKQLDALM